MYATHEPCTSASDEPTLLAPRASLEIFMRAGIMQLDAPQLAMRRTEQIACLVLYLVPWRSVCGGQGTTVHKPDQSPARPCAAPLPMMMRPPRPRGEKRAPLCYTPPPSSPNGRYYTGHRCIIEEEGVVDYRGG